MNSLDNQCLDKLIPIDLDPAIYLDPYLIHNSRIFLFKIF